MSYKSWAKAQIPIKTHTTEVYWDKTNHPIKPGTIVSLIEHQDKYINGVVVTRKEAAKRWNYETSKGNYGKNTVWVNWPNFGILQSDISELRKV